MDKRTAGYENRLERWSGDGGKESHGSRREQRRGFRDGREVEIGGQHGVLKKRTTAIKRKEERLGGERVDGGNR